MSNHQYTLCIFLKFLKDYLSVNMRAWQFFTVYLPIDYIYQTPTFVKKPFWHSSLLLSLEFMSIINSSWIKTTEWNTMLMIEKWNYSCCSVEEEKVTDHKKAELSILWSTVAQVTMTCITLTAFSVSPCCPSSLFIYSYWWELKNYINLRLCP